MLATIRRSGAVAAQPQERASRRNAVILSIQEVHSNQQLTMVSERQLALAGALLSWGTVPHFA
jgi:hypothetical protein